MKVAVPVNGEAMEIVTRTGRAPFFAIFEINEKSYNFIELRENLHSHEHSHEHEHSHGGGGGHGQGREHSHGGGGGHGQGNGEHLHGGGGGHHFQEEEYSEEEVRHHRNQLKNIGDVDTIIVRGLGPNMKGALEGEKIKVIRAAQRDGNTADELVKKFFVD